MAFLADYINTPKRVADREAARAAAADANRQQYALGDSYAGVYANSGDEMSRVGEIWNASKSGLGSWEDVPHQIQPGLDLPLPTFEGKEKASKTLEFLSRQQYDDWLTMFAPIEEKLIDMTTYSPNGRTMTWTELHKGRDAALGAIDNSTRMNEQYMNRFGAAIDPRVQAQNERMTKLTKSSAVANAASKIRQTLLDQDREIALGLSAFQHSTDNNG